MSTPAPVPDGGSALWQQAQSQFPILKSSGILYKYTPRPGPFGPGQGSHLETWPPKEEGTSESPRPKEFPIDQYGIEVYNPKAKTAYVMGDALAHVLRFTDPKVKQVYQQLAASVTPAQKQSIMNDYHHNVLAGTEHRPADFYYMYSGLPQFFGDFLSGGSSRYTPQQRQLADDLLKYITQVAP